MADRTRGGTRPSEGIPIATLHGYTDTTYDRMPYDLWSPQREHVMRLSRAGSALLSLGLVVGAAAGLGLVFGFQPARLPPALLNIALYKLTFLASGGLLVGGALLLRRARRSEQTDPAERSRVRG